MACPSSKQDKQINFWETLIFKYDPKSSGAGNGPDNPPACKCDPCDTKGEAPKHSESMFSLTSTDLEYITKLKQILEDEKKVKQQIDKIEQDRNKKGFMSRLWASKEKEEEPTCECRTRSEELERENKRLTDELLDLKLEMKHLLEKLEGPIARHIQSQKCKNDFLENELMNANQRAISAEEAHIAETNALRMKLQNACQQLCEISAINAKLKDELAVLECRCEELQDEMIQQKLNEAETIKKLLDKQNKTPTPAENPDTCPHICGNKMKNASAGDDPDSLDSIRKQLSRALQEASDCSVCDIAIPQDLKDTAEGIRDLLDIVGGRSKKDMPESQCTCQDEPEKDLPKCPWEHEPNKPKPPPKSILKCPCEATTQAERPKPKPKPKPCTCEPPPEPEPCTCEPPPQPEPVCICKEAGTQEPEPPEPEPCCVCTCKNIATQSEPEPQEEPEKDECSLCLPPPEPKPAPVPEPPKKPCSCSKPKPLPPPPKPCKCGRKAPPPAPKQEVKPPPDPCSCGKKEPEPPKPVEKPPEPKTCPEACMELVPVKPTPVKPVEPANHEGEEIELDVRLQTEGDVDVEANAEVAYVEDPIEGVLVTTAVTNSGTLEVITEGPAGKIETTMTYTESGNIEVLTEITEYEEDTQEPKAIEAAPTTDEGEFFRELASDLEPGGIQAIEKQPSTQENTVSEGAKSESEYFADESGVSGATLPDRRPEATEDEIVNESPTVEENQKEVVEEMTKAPQEPILEEAPPAQEPETQETPAVQESAAEEIPAAQEPAAEETPAAQAEELQKEEVAEAPAVAADPGEPQAVAAAEEIQEKTPDVLEDIKEVDESEPTEAIPGESVQESEPETVIDQMSSTMVEQELTSVELTETTVTDDVQQKELGQVIEGVRKPIATCAYIKNLQEPEEVEEEEEQTPAEVKKEEKVKQESSDKFSIEITTEGIGVDTLGSFVYELEVTADPSNKSNKQEGQTQETNQIETPQEAGDVTDNQERRFSTASKRSSRHSSIESLSKKEKTRPASEPSRIPISRKRKRRRSEVKCDCPEKCQCEKCSPDIVKEKESTQPEPPPCDALEVEEPVVKPSVLSSGDEGKLDESKPAEEIVTVDQNKHPSDCCCVSCLCDLLFGDNGNNKDEIHLNMEHPVDCDCPLCSVLCSSPSTIIEEIPEQHGKDCTCNDCLYDLVITPKPAEPEKHPPDCYCIDCICEARNEDSQDQCACGDCLCEFGVTPKPTENNDHLEDCSCIDCLCEGCPDAIDPCQCEDCLCEFGVTPKSKEPTPVCSCIDCTCEGCVDAVKNVSADSEVCQCINCQCCQCKLKQPIDQLTQTVPPDETSCSCILESLTGETMPVEPEEKCPCSEEVVKGPICDCEPFCECDNCPGVNITKVVPPKEKEDPKEDNEECPNGVCPPQDPAAAELIEKMESEDQELRNDMNDLKNSLEQIRCACAAAESQAVTHHQIAPLQSTMSGLQVALANMEDKCKVKDQMIEALTQELKQRADSKVFDSLLENLAKNPPPAKKDYTRMDVCDVLPKPGSEQTRICSDPNSPECPFDKASIPVAKPSTASKCDPKPEAPPIKKAKCPCDEIMPPDKDKQSCPCEKVIISPPKKRDPQNDATSKQNCPCGETSECPCDGTMPPEPVSEVIPPPKKVSSQNVAENKSSCSCDEATPQKEADPPKPVKHKPGCPCDEAVPPKEAEPEIPAKKVCCPCDEAVPPNKPEPTKSNKKIQKCVCDLCEPPKTASSPPVPKKASCPCDAPKKQKKEVPTLPTSPKVSRIKPPDGCICPGGGVAVDPAPLDVTDVRKVAPDSLLVKWIRADNKLVTGYEIEIDGVVKSRIFSTNRTSAVVHGLDIKADLNINVFAVTKSGRCLPPAKAIFHI